MRKHSGVSLMVGDIKMIFRTFDAVITEGDISTRKEHTLEFAVYLSFNTISHFHAFSIL